MPKQDKENKENEGGLPSFVQNIWMPFAGFIGAVTLAYNFYKLWQGDQTTVTFIIAGAGLSVLLVALWWVGFSKEEKHTSKTSTRRDPRYAKKYQWGARILLFFAIIGIGYSAWMLEQHRKEEKAKFIIIIAAFEGPEDIYGLRNEIIEQVTKDLDESTKVEIRPISEVITPEKGSKYARELGEKYSADIVLWAWYRPSEVTTNVAIHIENLAEEQLATLDKSTTCRLSASIEDLENFRFQFSLSSETSALINYWAGLIAYQGDDYLSAIERFTKSIEHKIALFTAMPIDLPTVYYFRGDSYRFTEEYASSISDYDVFINSNPEHYCAYYNRGTAYVGMDQYEEALASFERAVTIDPKNYATYVGIGTSYSQLKEWKKAIESYNKAMEINPEDWLIYTGLGHVYTEAGNYDKAVSFFTKAEELGPDESQIYTDFGTMYFRFGKYDEAIKKFNRAIQLDPKNSYNYTMRGGIYLTMNNVSLGFANLEKALQINDEDALAYYFYGLYYYTQKDHDRALSNLETSIEYDPQAVAYLLIGTIYQDLEDYETALSYFDKAIALDSESADAYVKRAGVYYLLEQDDKGQADLEKFNELSEKRKEIEEAKP
jgi:tetratricopeptide (TPR) repeat protein